MLGVAEAERCGGAPLRVRGRANHNQLAVRGATLLGVAATITSAGITYLAGLERGGSTAEQTAWISVGVVVLLAAHMLPGLASSVRGVCRPIAFSLWAIAMAATGYTHATFFMNAQRHAGQMRAQRIRDVQAPRPPGAQAEPSISAIAHDRAIVLDQLATVRAARCLGHCPKLTLLRDRLTYRLDELNTDAAEASRRESAQDRAVRARKLADERRQLALIDPVTRALANVAGLGISTVNFVVALTLGWLLEGVACFSWTVVISHRFGQEKTGIEHARTPDSEVGPAVRGVVGRAREPANDGVAQVRSAPRALDTVPAPGEKEGAASIPTASAGSTSDEPNFEAVARAVARGELRPTVGAIRAFVGCSEGRAMAIRRQLAIESAGVLL